MWNDGACRGDETDRMTEGIGIQLIWSIAGNAMAVVVAVVGAIRQVERLRKQLQVHALSEFDVLREARVEFKEGIAAKRIVLCNRASLGNAVQPIEAVLGSRVSSGATAEVGGRKS